MPLATQSTGSVTLDNARFDDSLHLAVSMRSFRAENVSAFVKALLDCERDSARASGRGTQWSVIRSR